MVEMTLEMEAALADICRLDRGQSFVDVALAIIAMQDVRDQREYLLQALVWVLENQREAVFKAQPLPRGRPAA